MGYGPWGLDFWQIIIMVCVFFWLFKPRSSRRFDRAFDDFRDRHQKDKAAYEEAMDAYEEALDAAEDKIEKLEDRIRVLERIVTDTHQATSLAEEIDNLRQAR